MVIPNITKPETLEGMACLEALALAEDCGIQRIIVASDCLNIVSNINEMPLCAYVMILKDI
jgi:ribonuclease HI